MLKFNIKERINLDKLKELIDNSNDKIINLNCLNELADDIKIN